MEGPRWRMARKGRGSEEDEEGEGGRGEVGGEVEGGDGPAAGEAESCGNGRADGGAGEVGVRWSEASERETDPAMQC